jgi:hypothetical protein
MHDDIVCSSLCVSVSEELDHLISLGESLASSSVYSTLTEVRKYHEESRLWFLANLPEKESLLVRFESAWRRGFDPWASSGAGTVEKPVDWADPDALASVVIGGVSGTIQVLREAKILHSRLTGRANNAAAPGRSTEDVSDPALKKRKRGPKPNKNCFAIAEVVGCVDSRWRDAPTWTTGGLEAVCKMLDDRGISTPSRWTLATSKWTRAFKARPGGSKKVVGAITHALKMAHTHGPRLLT